MDLSDYDKARDAVAKIIIFYCAQPGLPDVQAWADDIAEQILDVIRGQQR